MIETEEKVGLKMERNYWEQFKNSGRVEDYLQYRGIESFQNKMEQYGEKSSESVKYSDRDDSIGNTDRRI